MKRSRTIAGFMVLAMLLLYVSERVGVVKTGYDIEKLKTQKVKLERERDELRVKLSALTAPDRIAKVAMDTLGMISPQQGQVVMVRLESSAPKSGSPALSVMQLAKYEPGGQAP
jgi:cell division protein FtsL